MPNAAGANIANAAGRPVFAGTPWSAAVIQDPLGAYVRDSLWPTVNTNYIGGGVKQAWTIPTTDPMGASNVPDWIIPFNYLAAAGGLGQWVKNSATALIPTDRVNIVSGVATKNATGTHDVFATVAANQFFWAVSRT